MIFETGQRVRISKSGVPRYGTVRHAIQGLDSGWTLFVVDDHGALHEVKDTDVLGALVADGGAPT